jgi:PTS system ascorbate-specific IIA component
MENTEENKKEKLLRLSDLIKPNLILLDLEAKDREDAIMLGCSVLIDDGAVTKEYCELILKSLVENGPYFVIAPHFALSHAKPINNCVKRVAMSFLRLKTPIIFGNKENDPVDIIITLATPDSKIHINALAELSEMLMVEETWKVLREGSKEEILKLVEHFSEE